MAVREEVEFRVPSSAQARSTAPQMNTFATRPPSAFPWSNAYLITLSISSPRASHGTWPRQAEHSALPQDRARRSQDGTARGCLHGSTAQGLQERFWFCSREKQEQIWKTLIFLHKTAFQPPCFLLSLPKRRQTCSHSQPSQFSCSKAGGLAPLLQTSPFKPFPTFPHPTMALIFPHPSFLSPICNTSFIILHTSQVNDCYPHPLLPYIYLPTLAVWTYFLAPV